MKNQEATEKRRTFGIISHPDAGKTTLTEKLLLFGGAIQTAGAVKNNKIKKTATSDFMEIEKQRGISVATSVMAFEYNQKQINILDTPGHKDFAEDTFRTLTAVDSVILVIDCANGVEEQTERLMPGKPRNVCTHFTGNLNFPKCSSVVDSMRLLETHRSLVGSELVRCLVLITFIIYDQHISQDKMQQIYQHIFSCGHLRIFQKAVVLDWLQLKLSHRVIPEKQD